jgi:hypothetical protein
MRRKSSGTLTECIAVGRHTEFAKFDMKHISRGLLDVSRYANMSQYIGRA